MKYRAYPEYKDSGVEWLEEIPKHWEIKKLKFIANVQPSNVDKKTDASEIPVLLCNYTDVYYNDTVNAEMDFMKASATEIQINKFTLQAGDTIITKDSEDPNDIAIPAFVPATIPGVICGYHLAIIRPYDINYGAFIKRVFECGYARAYFSTRSNGLTRYGLGTYPLDNVSYPKPTKEEATIIANFLDHETAKIDALITKQQRLIELLKEKRQAVISHAVTKGINPNTPMKDSGVEWLGEVPEHWNITEIRFITNQIGGGTPSKDKEEYWNGNIPWVSPKDMKVDYIDDSQDKITEDAVKNSSTKLIPKGSVLIVMRGMILIHSVPVALTLKKVTVNQDMKALLPIKEVINGEYLLLLLKGLRNFILDLVEESAHGTKCLRTESFDRMKVAIPSIDEQIKIFIQLRKKISAIDSLVDKAKFGIDLLQERRTALISAAVTGKIDVRNFKTASG